MADADAVPLVAVTRSGFTESVHAGPAVVIDRHGAVTAYGDADAPIYPHSELKPFQTVAALRAGASLTPTDLAIVSASHTGRPEHVAAVLGVLAAYLTPGHPIHAAGAAVLEEFCGARPEHQGVDGCGGPVWALPLVALARGLQALVTREPGLLAAMRAHPDLVDGPGTATSAMVAALGVAAKPGAEGVLTAVAPDGTAVAVKALDGGRRPGAFLTAILLAGFGAVDAEAAARFLDSARFRVPGGGRTVGALHPLI